MSPTLPAKVDVVVIGAGPAGLTLAALLVRYRPGTEVLVLERERFPRHRIGEGFIVDINRVLHDMGALEKVEAEGFPRKWGTTFLWGSERRPSTFLFEEAQALVDPPEGYQLDYTWHVDRPRFDELLAEVAVEQGARFVDGQSVVGIRSHLDKVTGVRTRDDEGREQIVEARWVIDCGGLHGPLSQSHGRRVLDPAIRNMAVWGYYEDLGWSDELNGPPDKRRTLILTHPRGWVWVIPVSRERTSVGLVTSLETYQELSREAGGEKAEPRQVLEVAMRELAEYQELFGQARLVDHREDGRYAHVMRELSYTCERVWGPGWVLAGDAAGFVDPVLSIGVYVVMAHAQYLAYALGSVLDGTMSEELALGSYAAATRENVDAFRAVSHMFYAFNTTRSDWWRACSDLLRTSAHVPDGADRQAFLAFVSGFAARHGLYEEAINAFGADFLASLGTQLFPDEPLFDERQLEEDQVRARDLVRGDPTLELRRPWSLRRFALPETGTGRLREVSRLDLAAEEEPHVHAIARRLILEPELREVPALLNGRRPLSEVVQRVAAGLDEAPSSVEPAIRKLVRRLSSMGALVEA